MSVALVWRLCPGPAHRVGCVPYGGRVVVTRSHCQLLHCGDTGWVRHTELDVLPYGGRVVVTRRRGATVSCFSVETLAGYRTVVDVCRMEAVSW
jgi:hypothetical protein